MEFATLIEARDLVKRFGDLVAVDSINFTINPGEVVGFLGPNGAGKTTTIRMVTCTSPLTGGFLSVFGLEVQKSPREIKAKIGVVSQDDNYDPDLSVAENLLTYGRYFRLDSQIVRQRTEELLDFVQLTEKAGRKVEELSGGMKRRLILARSLINDPALLVLDEPTTGLDPQARRLIWQRIRELRARGKTILITTHYMDEAEQICDRLLVMDHGKIIAEGSPQHLVQQYAGQEILEIIPEQMEEAELLEALKSCPGYQQVGDRYEIFSSDCPGLLETIRARVSLKGFGLRKATLEDVFIRLTGRELRD